MSNLIPFKFEGNEIRTIVENGDVWVAAKDVTQALEYAENSNPARLISAVPDEWKGVKPIHTLGGSQEVWCLSEQGLYFFLGRSDKPKAFPFQMWLAGEVVPSLRKTGSYSLAQQPRVLATDTILNLPACIEGIKALFPNLGEASLQALAGDICEIDLGRRLIPSPVITETFYTTSAIAEEAGVTPQKLGRVAAKFKLRTKENGEVRLSKSRYSSKQVEQFYWNARGRKALLECLR